MSLLIRRITLAVLSLALIGAAFTLPAAAKKDPVASASKCKKKKGKKASVAKKKKKRCGSVGGSGGRGESTLPGVPTRPTPQAPGTPPAPPPAPGVTALSVTDNPVLGGRTTDAQVAIDAAAPSGGQQVDLQTTDASRASVPSAVQVAAGQSTANFTIDTTAGPTTAPVITASIGSTSKYVVLSVVDKPSIVALTLDHNCYPGAGLSNYGSNRVTLDVAAPIDESVGLASDSGALTVPTSVTVPSGSKTAIFGIGTTAIQTTPLISVTGTLFSSQASDSTTVRDTGVASRVGGLSINPDHVTVGGGTTGVVALNCEALSGGQVVHLHSDNPDVTFSPSNAQNQDITVSQDSLTSSFQINVSGSASAGTANITAETVGTDANIAVLTIDDLGT